jgi:SNF2 family DNA or RNA helicase
VTYEPKLPPRDYQAREFVRMEDHTAWALLCYMRTGKSKMVLDDFGRLEEEGKVQDLLVVAPAGVYLTWKDEVDKHLSTTLYTRMRLDVWRSGKKMNSGFLQDHSRPRIFLVNVEALSTATGARQACEAFLKDRRVMTAVDESTVIKGPGTKRTEYVIRSLAPLSKYRRILSGLPTPRSPLDLFSQFYFLDPRILGYTTYSKFRSHYAVLTKKPFGPGGRLIDIVTGYQNLDELQAKIAPHSSRVTFRPDIPPTWTIRQVPLTAEQQRVYRELKEYATTKLAEDSYATATVVLAQISKLHQVLCGHVVDEQGVTREIPEHKTDQLMELLDDYSGKAVVWVTYDADVRKVAFRIAQEYGPGSVARFWGGNLSTREAEERKFKEDPTCRFMVATASAGGRGRTWDVADLVVYYSSSFDLEHREQSVQRVHAVDKKRQVDYIDLVAPGTVEEKILDALRKKIDLAAAITNDGYREWVV